MRICNYLALAFYLVAVAYCLNDYSLVFYWLGIYNHRKVAVVQLHVDLIDVYCLIVVHYQLNDVDLFADFDYQAVDDAIAFVVIVDLLYHFVVDN